MNRLHTLLILVLLVGAVAFPQAQSGKISGVVLDQRTREPLIGVNVVIEGERLGGTTDINGRYVILKVPPGVFSVSASMLGYNKVTQRNVEVFIDRTTELNFRLSDAAVEMQEVNVVAERPKIVKDQTSTSTTLDNREISSIATEGLRGVIDLSASFQRDAQGNFLVRGSGAYEVNVQINGVSQVNSSTSAPGSFGSDKANNSYKYDINPIAVQQVQLISGGFTAEYGEAQAGVVKVVTKEGTSAIKGEMRVEVRPSGQYHFGPYLYDRSNYEWREWGTLEAWHAKRGQVITDLGLDQRYADLKRRADQGDQEALRQYTEIVNREIAWAHDVWVKNHTPSDDNPLGVYDYRKGWYTRYLWGIGGPLGRNPDLLKFFFSGEYRKNPTRLPTAERDQIFQNYILSLTYTPIANHKFKFTGTYQNYRGGIWSGSDDIRWSGLAFTPPGASPKYYVKIDPVRNERTVSQTMNWVWAINDRSYFETTLSHQTEKYELPYEYLTGYETERDRLDSLNDPRGQVLKPGAWWQSSYFRSLFNFSTNYYQDNRTENWGLTADYSNQITTSHFLKAGVKLYYWDMINNGVNSSFLANTYVTRSGFAEYYRAYPVSASFYVQDKMEFKSMVANIGVRGEMYNFQTPVAADPFNPFYQGEFPSGGVSDRGDPATVPSKTQYVLLPRIGVSFPIGENTAFRIQYGHFTSMPIFSQALSQRTESGWIGRGNPDLEPKKTINYEFGLQQVLDVNHRIDFSVYYNDRVSQIGLLRYAAITGSLNRYANATTVDNRRLYLYTSFANNAFGSTIGLEVKFEKISIGRWSYRLSYNLSQTTAGNYGPQILFPDNAPRYQRDNFTGEFLSSSDRTHAFRGLLQLKLDEGEGISIFGIRPFENSVWSLTYTAQSGTPFTYVTQYDLRDVVNNRRYPLESSVDLNVIRTLNVGGLGLTLGVRVMNLFNNKWLTPMDVANDISSWVENGVTLMDPADDPLRLSHVVAQYRTYRNIPRQVFFTLGVAL